MEYISDVWIIFEVYCSWQGEWGSSLKRDSVSDTATGRWPGFSRQNRVHTNCCTSTETLAKRLLSRKHSVPFRIKGSLLTGLPAAYRMSGHPVALGGAIVKMNINKIASQEFVNSRRDSSLPRIKNVYLQSTFLMTVE